METRTKILTIAALALATAAGCSGSSSTEPVASGGTTSTGGTSATGGTTTTGGTSATGGSSNTGGTSATGGTSVGSSATGGSSDTGGTKASGGSTANGGTSATGGTTSAGGTQTQGTGGRSGMGGATGLGGTSPTGGSVATGGTTGPGGAGGRTGAGGTGMTGGRTGAGGTGVPDAGNRDLGGAEVGADTGSGGFDPCPTNGDPCKILPLGDSITWGINYGGGYRIKLAIHAATDSKNITYVGYDTANPPDSTALAKLGSASSKYVNKHEGHSGWTIQQDDDLVTGKSTATNDSVNYSGKKVVADFGPHIVLVHLGTNDMYQTPTGADTRLGTLIDHIVADAPNALVVVSSIIPFPSGASAVSTFNKAVPGVVKQRADAGKHVLYVDQFTGFATSDLGSDQVHPNEGGYEKMAVVWYNGIKPYLH
jgi:lysophospholipase L1-like esterase